jgi:photosystem II stability/assembly factor-like uncharacterized protein
MTMLPQHNDGMSAGPPRFFSFVQLPSGTVLTGSCTRGMSKSTDGGSTWTPVDQLTHVSENGFAIEADSSLLVATSGGLARSTDEGRSWNFLDDQPRYATLPDGTGGPEGEITYRFLELADGRVIAATEANGVWVREEGTWAPLGLDGTIVYGLVETPGGDLLAGTRGDFIQRSSDGGATWQPSSEGLSDSYVHSLIQHGDDIYAGTGVGIARSDDTGRTWKHIAEPLAGNRIFSLIALNDGEMLAGSYAHVWRGSGESWELVDPGLTPDEAWAVHAAADRLLAGTKAGVLQSTDRGHTWQRAGEQSVVYNFLTTSGNEVLAAGDLGVMSAVDWQPRAGFEHRGWSLAEPTPGVILVGTLTDGLYRLDSHGWSKPEGGPDHQQILHMLHTQSGALIASTGAIIDKQKSGGLWISYDDGQTWSLQWVGKNVYRSIQLSDGTLFAGARRCHVLTSTDAGLNWSACPPAVEHEAKTYMIGVDHLDRVFLGAGGQLLRSDDKAQTWTVLDEGIDGVSVYALTETPEHTLVAATNVGMFHSDDGGDTWTQGTLPADV